MRIFLGCHQVQLAREWEEETRKGNQFTEPWAVSNKRLLKAECMLKL